MCGAQCCGRSRLHNVEFDAIPHHASPLPASARHWLFGVETCFVATAIMLAAVLLDRNITLSRGSSQTAEEVVPLTLTRLWVSRPSARLETLDRD